MQSTAEYVLSRVPEPLQPMVENYWSDWCQSCQRNGIDHEAIPLTETGYVWSCSDFVARNCIRYPEMFLGLLHEGFTERRHLQDYKNFVSRAIDNCTGVEDEEAKLMKSLRELRQQEMLRIAWRDLNSLADIEIILQELTDLAEAFVSVTLQYLEQQLSEKFGMPVDDEGDAMPLLVFAMGKMGGGELNFSSDIDLIFTYPEEGETTGRRKTSHAEFYLAVIRKLVKVLDEVTVDGFVYRVDTRLRPFGASGPMAMSFSGLEQYYQLHGRDWERYAMIKARLISGRDCDKRYLQKMLTPFVYRRYLDFSMIDSIRNMKAMINTQMKNKGMVNNIKLGHGGIREIEFIAQTLQLIRAGREPELQERSIKKVIAILAEKKYLKRSEPDALITAYRFLRRLENRLQMLNDKQTHSLPDDALHQQRICLAMSVSDWSSLQQQLSVHQYKVDQIFQNLITKDMDTSKQTVSAFVVFWSDAGAQIEKDEASNGLLQYLEALGYRDVDQICSALSDLQTSSAIKNLSGDSAHLMMQVVESLIKKIVDYPESLQLLRRVSRILKALAGRKVYISLLNEYPETQLQMLTLCSTSEWFTERLTRYPILLDSLLSTADAFRQQYDIRKLLEVELNRIDTANIEQDLEQLMERMRQFKRQTEFTVAMLDVFYGEPVELVSDYLTELADVLLEKILDYSWQAMVDRYGVPQCMIEGELFLPKMSVIAYGKLGGNELGYGSDLDIIFMHNSQGDKQVTDGERSLDNQQFFARVAQRVIHFLNTRSYSGVLYEADTRLRPDGQAGLMVSSFAAFESYQREKAWTWEHQALIRARFVTGDTLIEQEFDRIRSSILQQQRDVGVLLREVVEMREKMRAHLGNKSEDFDIKQDRGGLVDIEFMTQAGILIHAVDDEACIRHTATLPLIDVLVGVGWYSDQDASRLSDAYRTFRKMKNWQNLQCEFNDTAVSEHRDNVAAIWHRLMPDIKA